uniref:Skp1_POZ domain-containing protein n=1 Tax=Caenorhabditis tropicalis TaxID=1561998 RepID=A0A1I7UBS9_9PELO
MAPISLKIMYSDVIATIEDGVKEKVTLNDETDVSGKVETYLKEHFERKEEELEEIFILLVSTVERK